MNKKPFKFKGSPKSYSYADCWQFGVRDGLFHLSLGLKTDLENNEGDFLHSFVMNPNNAKEMYRQLGRMLNPPKQNEPPNRF